MSEQPDRIGRDGWRALQERYGTDGPRLPDGEATIRSGYAHVAHSSAEREGPSSDVFVHVTEGSTRIDLGNLELYADARGNVTLLKKHGGYPIGEWEVLVDRRGRDE